LVADVAQGSADYLYILLDFLIDGANRACYDIVACEASIALVRVHPAAQERHGNYH
jgi:hypothetical protein